MGYGIINSGAIDTGSGNDTITASNEEDNTGIRNVGIINTGSGEDVVTGVGLDRFSGFNGGGRIDLGMGNDTIIGFGKQTVFGGEGFDTARFRFKSSAVTINSDGDRSTKVTHNGITMTFFEVEQFAFADGIEAV